MKHTVRRIGQFHVLGALAAVILTSGSVLAADSLPSTGSAAAKSSTVVTDAAIRDWFSTHPEAVDKILHDSLMRQPGLLGEINQAQAAKHQADQEARLRDALPKAHAALYDDPRDGREGAAKAAATLVIFADSECPYCKSIQPTLARLVAEHTDVAVIYKDFPILGPISTFAAKASLAAVGQGKYPALHAALMASKIPEHQLKEEQILEMAKTAGIDVERLKTDMAAPEIEVKIAATKTLAMTLGIQGTPGVIIGNQLVPANVPYERFVQLLEEAKVPGRQAALSR
jgi:protein-disulfide isomerase